VVSIGTGTESSPGRGRGRVAARVELTPVSYQKCSKLLVAGEVKRVMQSGPLIGYFLACPACGFACAYLDEACGYVEDPPKTVVTRAVRKLVAITHPPTCFRCKRTLHVEGGFLEACDP
jgi:hypothetical protein